MDRHEMLRRMMVIREFERIIKELARVKEVDGAIHCYTGEEAVAVGVWWLWPKPLDTLHTKVEISASSKFTCAAGAAMTEMDCPAARSWKNASV